jgi:ketosteroid isomerase-like protein
VTSAAFSPASARRRTVSISNGHPHSLVPLYLADSNTNDKSDNEKDKEFERAVRIAKAKKDIDMILSGPDAPFDLEGELKKVQGISPPLAASKEQQLDDQVSELESELYAAVESQDYALASKKKEEIGKLHMDDCGAVLQVNSAFYRAFSEKDYEAMEKIWLKDGSALCIHPSHPPLVGANAVLKSWSKMFDSSANGNFQRNWMDPDNIRLTVKGATAIITCDEQVYCRRFVRGKKRQTELVNKLTATNIFRKVDGKWYMVHHHSSWHADSEAAKMALKGGSMEGVGKLLDDKKSKLRRNKSDVGEISPDGFIGNFGPILGGPSPSPPQGPSVKRIVMGGSLSDLLNGGLNDLLSGSIAGDDQQDEEGSAIIHFQRISDDDSDDDGEDDDHENEDGETEAVSIMRQWAKSKDGKEGSSSSSSSASGGITSGGSNGPKDVLRQNCISALRKLCNQGSISPKQKRVLLTDIITCSAKGEFSMVEVAYELLCGEGEDKDAAEEEFAEQCRVFAHSLPQAPPFTSSS